MGMNLNMDSLVSRLRKTVSEVAYQVNTSVNTIIPGNAIHREYEAIKLRCTYGCPGFVWNVYDATKRDSVSIKASLKDAIGPNLMPNSSSSHIQLPDDEATNNEKQLYSMFIFDKSQIDGLHNKSEKEAALDHIKQGVTQLTRLRHPSILIVHHPLGESRSSLAFVTEHVYGSLESILKEQRKNRVTSRESKLSANLVDLTQDLGPKDSDYQSDSCQLDEVQIKAGLLQVCDGLKFLHNDAKMLHRNLCFENIFVDTNNTWKIAGFDFSCLQSRNPTTAITSHISQETSANLQIVEFTPKMSNSPLFPSLKTIYPSLPSAIIPNWSCSAPEHSNHDQVTFSSDIYSLGIISCGLLADDTDLVDLSYEYGLISDTYKRGLHFRELADRLPSNIKASIMRYAAMNVESRPSLDDYQNLTAFNDPHVRAIRDLESRYVWDRLRKIDFFNSLRDILPKLSHQVKVNRVAKSLFNDVVNPDMLPHVLPSILIIAKDSTPSEFKFKIFPSLKGPFRVLEPKSVPLMLLDNMVVLADRAKLCLPEFKQYAFTLIQYLLKMDLQMQEQCLSVLPNVKNYIDENSMNTMILPELKKLCFESTASAIRLKCIDCIDKMIDVMSTSTIVKQVLPILFDLPSREACLVMAATGVIKTIVNNSSANLDKEVIAGKILPFLIPLSIEKELNLSQFDSILNLIKNLMDRVEREQRALLARKHQVSTHKSTPLVLDNFKGSNHFQLN